MFSSFLEKAKGAVKDAAGKVKEQANGMAKLLNAHSHHVGEDSYLVRPEQFTLGISKSAPHLLAMKCPVEDKGVIYSGQADLHKVSRYLNSHYGSNYLIVNVSDTPYDYTAFEGKVEEFFFPGYPAPPIKVIVQMCVTVDQWLAAKRREREAPPLLSEVDAAPTSPPVVLFHCKTGKGRTAVALACYLGWINASPSPMQALDEVCRALAMPIEMVTIPSQRRYIEYFTNILDGAKPAARTLILSRVIVHSVPQFGAASPGTEQRSGLPGCHPELRIVKNGKVLFKGEHSLSEDGKQGACGTSTEATIIVRCSAVVFDLLMSLCDTQGGKAGDVRAGEGVIKFDVNMEMQSDIVLSFYHIERRGVAPGGKWKRVFMFRAQFYTGFVKENMLRFTRSNLDGTSENSGKFAPDFFVEAFFDAHPVGNDFRLPSSWKVCRVAAVTSTFNSIANPCTMRNEHIGNQRQGPPDEGRAAGSP